MSNQASHFLTQRVLALGNQVAQRLLGDLPGLILRFDALLEERVQLQHVPQLLTNRLVNIAQVLRQCLSDLLDKLLLLLVAMGKLLILLLVNLPGLARLFGELLLRSCQIAELPVQVCKLSRYLLLERSHLLEQLLLLLRDAGEIQHAPVSRDPGVRVKNRGQCCQVGETNLAGLLVNPHAHRVDRQHPLGDPGSDGVLLPPCDPAGVGHRYPAITRAGEFGHVYFLLSWVF